MRERERSCSVEIVRDVDGRDGQCGVGSWGGEEECASVVQTYLF